MFAERLRVVSRKPRPEGYEVEAGASFRFGRLGAIPESLFPCAFCPNLARGKVGLGILGRREVLVY